MSHHHIIAFIIAVAVAVAVLNSPQLQKDLKNAVSSLRADVTQLLENH